MALMPALVPVNRIQGAPARSHFPPAAIEEAAHAVLEARGLATPLVVKQSGIDAFTLVAGSLAYHVVARARELEPRQVEKVLAFVVDDALGAALERQLTHLAGFENNAVRAASSERGPGLVGEARLDNFELEIRSQFHDLRRQLEAERAAIESHLQALGRQMPRALNPLEELNRGDTRAVSDFLKLGGLKGKTLEQVVANVLAGRPFESLADAAKNTKKLSADCLLRAVEKSLSTARCQPLSIQDDARSSSVRSLELAR